MIALFRVAFVYYFFLLEECCTWAMIWPRVTEDPGARRSNLSTRSMTKSIVS